MFNTKRVFRALAWMALSASLALTACDGKRAGSDDPKGRLSEYITKSFAINSPSEKAVLLSYMTGDARRRLEAWSEDQFRQAFMDSKRKFIKLSFKEVKSTSPTTADITYELTYQDHGKGHDAKVTNKKLCQMVNENGKWVIADVKNIKELVEYQNELSLP